MMLVGGGRAAQDGNFPKIYGEVGRERRRQEGADPAPLKMTALMIGLTAFTSQSAHAADLFNVLTTDAVLLTMLPYFYSSINLIRFEA